MRNPRHVVIIGGPTASGKSALAMQMAREQSGVIINADSLQAYDALPILTARPTLQDMQEIPHCLYGFLSPHQTLSAMDWAKRAIIEIGAAQEKGLLPIVAGGTGFYLKTLVSGLSPIPDIPESIRVMTQDMMDKLGREEFLKELANHDPAIVAHIDIYNSQRLVRAMEVFLGTGKPLSYWQSIKPILLAPDLVFQIHLVMPDRNALYERINNRFLTMMSYGALQEVSDFEGSIDEGSVPLDSACTHALGFRPLQAHIKGEMDLESAIILSQNESRHYAKRQVTWFRHQFSEFGGEVIQYPDMF